MALKGCDFHQFSPAGWATPHHKYANADHPSQESIFIGLRENQPWLLAQIIRVAANVPFTDSGK
jgi:hypothetical protein